MTSIDPQQLGRRLKTPSGALTAIAILRQNPNDLELLNALVNLCADPECWQVLRDADVVHLFIDLMIRMPERLRKESDPFPSWLLPLQGLFNSLVGMQRCDNGFNAPSNRKALTHLLEESPAICIYIYGCKDDICSSEETAQNIRRSLIGWLEAIWNGAGMLERNDLRRKFKESHIIQLSTWCWLSSQSTDLRSKAAVALADVIEQPDPTKEDLDKVIDACGSVTRLVKIMHKEVIQDENLMGDYLANNLSLLVTLTSQTVHPQLTRKFAIAGTTVSVLTAIRRQLQLCENYDDTWRIIECCGTLIVNIANETNSPTDELTNMITSHSLIPLLGGVLLRYVEQNKTCISWLSLLSLLKHTCTCKSPECRVRSSPAYIAALRTHLSWRWWPTLQKLSATNSDISKGIQKEWITLSILAGLNQDSERRKFESGEGILGCWWVKCINSVKVEPASNPNLQKCSVCKKALYCSPSCQKGDWKDHKKKCQVWKLST